MKTELASYGVHVDAIYYCPHHPDDGCYCRKPGTALFLRAADDLAIDLKSSYVVGDMQMDIDAGKALNCRTVLLTTGSNPADYPVPEEGPDYVAEDLYRAAQWIISQPGTEISETD